jgi:electron transfer flavoprotein alpha subunit
MAGNIWVLAEQWRGQVSELTYEVLALGSEVATALGLKLQVVLLGHKVKSLADTLGKADSVLYVDHPALEEPTAETQSSALAQLVKELQPQSVLIPLTNITLGVGTLVSAQLQLPGINFCRDLRVVDGRLQAHCVLYGGKMEVLVTALREPAILGISPGARPAEKGRVAQAPAVEEVTVTLPEAPPVRFKKYIEPEAGGVDITKQDVLVAVGRGIQGQDNMTLAEELAQALGGAVCGSRPVIDQGWLPLARQVGKSGLTVKPKLYLAAGISGAPEHVEGMKNADLIIAVNTDPQAPIFNLAHYGIAGDVLEILPVLTQEVRKTILKKAG